MDFPQTIRLSLIFLILYKENSIGGPQFVAGTTPTLFNWVYEVKGKVHPSNFSYPLHEDVDAKTHDINYNHLHLARDVEAHYFIYDNQLQGNPPSEEWNSAPRPYPNDLFPDFQSNDGLDKSNLGNIYDIDAPGLIVSGME